MTGGGIIKYLMLLIGFVAFIYFPAGTADALPGGLLDGHPMYMSDREKQGYTNAVTDNNPSTGINMFDGYRSRRLTYEFPEDTQITAYQLNGGHNYLYMSFTDESGNVLYSLSDGRIQSYARVALPKINKVRKIVLSSGASDSSVISEFDVWGIVPDTIPPAVPDLSGAMNGKYAVLRWDKSEEADIEGFNVYRDAVKIAQLPNVQTYSAVQKVYDEKHTYTVSAFDTFGNVSKPSNAVVLALDRPVTENTQEAMGDYLLLKWQKTEGATGYRIYLNGRLIGSVGPAVFEYKITRAMGYIPGAISNRAEARAILSDGSEGGANNPVAPVIKLGAGYSVLDAVKAGLELVKLLNGWVLIVLSIILANMIIAFIYMINKKYKTKGG